MPRRRSSQQVFRTGENFGGGHSFFDNVVFPAASAAYAQNLQGQLGGAPATVRNLGFEGSDVDRQQNAFARSGAPTLGGPNLASRFGGHVPGRQVVDAAKNAKTTIDTNQAFNGMQYAANIESQLLGTGEGGLPFAQADQPGVITNPFAQPPSPAEQAKNELAGSTTQTREMADALQPHSAMRNRKAARMRAEISKAMGQGMSARQLAPAIQQFNQMFPEQAGIQHRPMTSEQYGELQTKITFSEQKEQFTKYAEELGVAAPPMVMGRDGSATIHPMVSKMMEAKEKQTATLAKAEAARMDSLQKVWATKLKQIDELEMNLRVPADDAPQSEKDAYRLRIDNYSRMRSDVYAEQTRTFSGGQEAPTQQDVPQIAQAPPPPVAAGVEPPTRLPSENWEEVYDKLPLGAKYIGPDNEERTKR